MSPHLPLTENPQVFEVILVKREVTITPPVVKDPKIITLEVRVVDKITWLSVVLFAYVKCLIDNHGSCCYTVCTLGSHCHALAQTDISSTGQIISSSHWSLQRLVLRINGHN